jgi:DNA helicase-2/ATP-dependent DNA helicase PcrA
MVDCSEDKWNRKSTAHGQFKLPPVLTSTEEETSAEEAQRRLFYVAMTRAKETLHISYSEGGRSSRVKFIDELHEHCGLEFVRREQSVETAIATHAMLLKEPPSNPDAISDNLIREKLSDFKLSASGLNSYLDCPVGFYYEQILGIPQAHSEYLSYGIAVHNSLEKAAFEHKRSGRLPDLNYLTGIFRFEVAAVEYLFSKERFRQFKDTGEKELAFFYEKQMCHWKPNAEAETSFRQGTIDGIPISGKIDRIEFNADGSVDIIDFKTGSFKKEYAKQLSETNPLGGIYRRQLIFYRLLYEQNIVNSKPVANVRLQYTRPGNTGEFQQSSDLISDDELARFKSLLQITYQKIMEMDFKDGCGKNDCKWCNFVKHHAAPDDFSNPDIDGLDDH